MHRIRDLGINVIPATMRPLEIGPGAAEPPNPFEQGYDFACAGTPGSQTCTNGTCPKEDDDKAYCPEDSRGSIGCEEGTCGGDEDDCQDSKKPRPRRQDLGAFSPEAVMQLQQQLEHHLGETLPN